jgi:hypothetical protein
LPAIHAENSICTPPVCHYVSHMNWQQILTLGIVLAVAVIFVWRSSNPSGHKHGCNCGCDHGEDESGQNKKNSP